MVVPEAYPQYEKWGGQREPILGVWGLSPQWGPGAKPLVGGSGGRSPPEADNISTNHNMILQENLI